MKSITQTKSLGDMRTSISTHNRSSPRREGSTYLEVYLLDREKHRLETELSVLAKRRGRIEMRLSEIREGIAKLTSKEQEGSPTSRSPTPTHSEITALGECAPDSREWRRMTVDY